MNVQPSGIGIRQRSLIGPDNAAAVETLSLDAPKGTSTQVAQHQAGPATRSEFAARQEHINRQVTHAQRSVTFLEQMLHSLQDFKSVLSSSIAGRTTAQNALHAGLAQVQTQWRARHAATGGALGPDLSFHDDGNATQSFYIRSLDLPALQNDRAEVLTVYPRGSGKPSVSLLLDGTPRPEREWVRRIDNALAASGITATLAEDDKVTFTTREADWEELRARMMIQGSGHRFPAGPPSRAMVTAAPPATDPTQWQTEGSAQRRATLRQVVQTIDHAQLVRDGLNRVLTQADAALHHDSTVVGPSGAAKIVATFDEALEHANSFQQLATVGAALRGLNAQRVRSVAS